MKIRPFVSTLQAETSESRNGCPVIEIRAKVILGGFNWRIESIDHAKIKDDLAALVDSAVVVNLDPSMRARATQEAQEPQGEE